MPNRDLSKFEVKFYGKNSHGLEYCNVQPDEIQADSVSCGDIVCMQILSLVRNGERRACSATKSDIGQFRLELGSYLLKNALLMQVESAERFERHQKQENENDGPDFLSQQMLLQQLAMAGGM